MNATPASPRLPHPRWRSAQGAALAASIALAACQAPAPGTDATGSAANVPASAVIDPVVAGHLQALEAPTPALRLDAAQALGQLGARAKGALEALTTHLNDPDLRVATAAANALGRLAIAKVKLGAAVEALRAAIATGQEPLQAAALSALTEAWRAAALTPAEVKALFEAITKNLGADAVSLRAAAADAAGRVMAAAGADLTEITRAPWHTKLRALLDDPADRARVAAARSLSRLTDLNLSDQNRFKALLADPEAEVRLWAMQALSRIDGFSPNGLSQLVHVLRNGDPGGLVARSITGRFDATVDDLVTLALGADTATRVQNVRKLLAEALPGDDNDVLWLAVYGLKQTGTDVTPFVPVLRSLLANTGVAVEVIAIEVLGAVATKIPVVATDLQTIAKRGFNETSGAAAQALIELARIDPKVRHELIEATHKASDQARATMADALGRIAQGSAELTSELLPALKGLAEDRVEAVRAAAMRQVAALLDSKTPLEDLQTLVQGALTTGTAAVKAASLEGLSTLSDPSTLRSYAEAILALLKDTDGAVRIAAARALGRLGNLGADAGEAISALASQLSDDLPAVRVAALNALAEFGDKAAKALPAILAALGSGAEGVREAAILALSKLGDVARSAIPALRALAIGDSNLARLAREALDRLDR